MRKVIVIDTSILCVWLGVPGKDDYGPDNDKWNFNRVNSKIKEEISEKSTLVLPIASIIETGNHIAQASGERMSIARKLTDIMAQSADGKSPWASFSIQPELWSPDKLKDLAAYWPQLAVQGIGIGDATIKDVAEYYAESGFHVEILTGDSGLKAYEPSAVPNIPRRKQKR